MFLHANDGDVDKAVTMLTKHYEIRSKAPQLFSNRDVLRPDLKSCFENQDYAHLPPTADYHLVCLHGLKNPIAKNYHYNQATTSFLMMIGNWPRATIKLPFTPDFFFSLRSFDIEARSLERFNSSVWHEKFRKWSLIPQQLEVYEEVLCLHSRSRADKNTRSSHFQHGAVLQSRHGDHQASNEAGNLPKSM